MCVCTWVWADMAVLASGLCSCVCVSRGGCSAASSIDWIHTHWNLTFTADVCQAAKDMHAHRHAAGAQSVQLKHLGLVPIVFFTPCLVTSFSFVQACMWSSLDLQIIAWPQRNYLTFRSWPASFPSQRTVWQMSSVELEEEEVCSSFLQSPLERPGGSLRVTSLWSTHWWHRIEHGRRAFPRSRHGWLLLSAARVSSVCHPSVVFHSSQTALAGSRHRNQFHFFPIRHFYLWEHSYLSYHYLLNITTIIAAAFLIFLVVTSTAPKLKLSDP